MNFEKQQQSLRQFSNVKSGSNRAYQLYKPQPPPSGDLFIKGTNNKIPLTSLEFAVEIMDSLAFVCLVQNYNNKTPNPI